MIYGQRKHLEDNMAENGLRYSGIPLGGLGTGSVELRSDGYFHEWQIMNNRPWGAGPEITVPQNSALFAMQVNGEDTCRTAVLGALTPYANYFNDPYHSPWLEFAESIDAETEFPFTRLTYHYKRALPVSVDMEAFSPFIPLDAKNSGLPLAFFTFTVRNNTNKKVAVSIVYMMRNFAGYTAQQNSSQMRYGHHGSAHTLLMTRQGLEKDAPDNGGIVIGAFGNVKAKFSHACHTRTGRDIWEPLRESVCLENHDFAEYREDLGDVGAARKWDWVKRGLPLGCICQTVSLAPKASQAMSFVLAWHFPNMYEIDCGECGEKGNRIGHIYGKWFKDARAVSDYGTKNFEKLHDETKAFTDAYYGSSLPRWALDAVSSQFTTLTKSSWWDEKDRFGIWEGLGCCGLQTMDITHYGSFPILQWFPELQKSQMRLTVSNIPQKGKIPHMMPGTFSCCDKDERNRIDLIPQFIVLAWRDVLWTGDLKYAKEMWPVVVDALEYFKRTDKDGDGLPNNTGPDQTYDQFPLKGTSSFVGFLYAAALKAASELGVFVGDRAKSEQYKAKFEDAQKKLDKQLWNGTYYRLCHDPLTSEDNEGVMADQVNGDWFIRQTTGEGMLPDAKVRSALNSILKYCGNKEYGFIANCAWPEGGEIKIRRGTSDQANTPWTGVEFAVAAHLALTGMEHEGWDVVHNIWERYERQGLRFNHIECGDHYYRALASWAVYLAWTGFAWDATQGVLTLKVQKKPSRFVVCTPECWCTVETHPKGSMLRLAVCRGRMDIRSIVLKDGENKTEVTVGNKPIRAGRSLVIRIPK
jgi:uncharacterized protein (DUF608 family)